jgi:N-acetylglutamate synthase-like GNAT family acetyltransferase
MPVAIRDAEIADMNGLQRVFQRASLSNEDDRGLLEEHPEQLVLSEEGIREKRTRVAVADDGTVVGFATYLISGGLAELEDLFVDPRWMRCGIGAALVRDVSARLDELRFDKLEVTANPHTMAFYERLGFAVDRVVDTPGHPASRMSRATRSPD